MPFKYELTWIKQAKKWRKRYQGETYYLKTKTNGKRDRQGYLDALREWERLKAYIDGFGPCPYSPTGAMIPENLLQASTHKPILISPTDWTNQTEPTKSPTEPTKTQNQTVTAPLWIDTPGLMGFLHPELIAPTSRVDPNNGERRLSALVDRYADKRQVRAEQGKLSLKQFNEDKRQLEVFSNWVRVNYPQAITIDQITAPILNHYRDHQETVCTSDITLRKRLQTVRKWFLWLLDESILNQPPRDLTTYGRIEVTRTKPVFFTVEEIHFLLKVSNPLLQACTLLALNAGFTQQDCSTLKREHIDLTTNILSRERNKTGVDQKAKLWGRTIEALQKVGRFNSDGPLLVASTGKPLVREQVTKSGKVSKTDHIAYLYGKAAKEAGIENTGKSFKHLRKTSANEIEKQNAELTPLFLAHADRRTARFYVQRDYEKLFEITDQLEAILFPEIC